jgi:hypothetical protein
MNSFGKLNLGVGYIWGFNPQAGDMLFKRKGAATLCGPPTCPPNGTLIRLNLVNDRSNIFAGHFNYPVGEMLNLPLNTTVRGDWRSKYNGERSQVITRLYSLN